MARRFADGRLVDNTEAGKIVFELDYGFEIMLVEVGVVLIGNWVVVGTLIGKQNVELV